MPRFLLARFYCRFTPCSAWANHDTWYFQPSCFVLGALWYGFTSILFYLIKPTLPVQDNLSRCFLQIAEVLNAKARLFDPDNVDNVEHLLYELSLKNSDVIPSLNTTKASYSPV